MLFVGDEARTRLLEFDRGGDHREAFPGQDDGTGVLPYAADVDAESGTAGTIVTGASEGYAAALDVTTTKCGTEAKLVVYPNPAQE